MCVCVCVRSRARTHACTPVWVSVRFLMPKKVGGEQHSRLERMVIFILFTQGTMFAVTRGVKLDYYPDRILMDIYNLPQGDTQMWIAISVR